MGLASLMASNSDVIVRDMGFQRAVDRLHAAGSCWVKVGVMRTSSEVKRYAAILEHLYGWKSRADHALQVVIDREMVRMRDDILAGGQSLDSIFSAFGERVAEGYRLSIATTPHGESVGLVDTGKFLASIGLRVRTPAA